MSHALPLRIFLASPGGLEAERQVVRTCVEEHNSRQAGEGAIAYEVVAWEQVRGTARRPQEAINELIGESHFLIALFKNSWGSEPGSPWGYTSGTEEELFTGLLALGQAEHPMRDVWTVFVDHSEPDAQVIDLRDQIRRTHAVMYESVSDIGQLKQKLTERLVGWASFAASKSPKHVDLLPSSGKDVLGAQRLRLKGEKLIELGQTEAGSAALKEASVLGGPLEQLALARFMSRRGNLDEAYAETQKAIDYFANGVLDLYSPLAAEAFAAQAGVLRRQQQHVEAIGRLDHALTLLTADDVYTRRVRCRILDDLGLAHQTVGELELARFAFDESLRIRRESPNGWEVSQSLVNLARLEVGAGNLEVGAGLADEAVADQRITPSTPLHANAEVLVAQIRLRQDRARDGLPHAERALAINRQLANRHGEAISLLLLAQCHRGAGNQSEAAAHAQACVELNESMGNEVGVQKAQWILDQLTG